MCHQHMASRPLPRRNREIAFSTTRKSAPVMKAAHEIGYPFGPIVQLLFMTAQRRDEVAGMRWSEINLDKGGMEHSRRTRQERKSAYRSFVE